MSSELLSTIKFPAFIKEEYPALVKFVAAYYRYLKTLESIDSATNVDTVNDKYLKQYQNTFLKNFGDPKFLSVRTFIQNNKDFFARKGTVDAFKFFFRAYYGEDIEVKTPNFLIASGGEISGSYFLYVQKTFGAFSVGDTLNLITSYGDFKVHVDNMVDMSNNVYAVYFNPQHGFQCFVDDKVELKINGQNVFVGKIIPVTRKISVQRSGKYWQVGQLIQFPSSSTTGTPTLARVKRVDSASGIQSIEIIKFGYPHTVGQTYVVSSFPTKPLGDSSTYTKVLTNQSPETYLHTLELNDTTIGISEDVYGIGIMTGSAGAYFAEAYASQEYSGEIMFSDAYTINETISVSDTDYTLAQWEESRATLLMQFDSYTRERQEYVSEDSIISNQNSKLHDNFENQTFAYFIRTQQNIEDYMGSIDLLNPAGMRFSAELLKTADIDAVSQLTYESEYA